MNGRLFLAVMACGIGVAAAVAVSGITLTHSERVCVSTARPDGSCPFPGWSLDRWSYRPGWVIPASVLVGFLGAAGGVAIVGRRS